VVPLVLGLIGSDGLDLPLATADGRRIERGMVVLSHPSESLTFLDIPERPVLSLNRGFSAPIKVFADTSAEDLQFLAAHDSDPFNRWEALQVLASSLLVEGVAGLRSGERLRGDAALIDALEATLSDPGLEPAFATQALSMPAEADIAREIGEDVDPDAIFRARSELRRSIGEQLGPALEQRYAQMSDRGPYRPDAASAGRRALKNACLDLLAMSGRSDAIDMAERQYGSADNMTDRMGALAALALHDVPARARCLENFYRTYESDPLVVDKWFALQASIPEPGTLGRVRALTAHPAFSFANPNRVRALIGAFAQGNQTQFNRADGAGYEFVAETVIDLDPKNPQVAARLLSAFKSWRALEETRRRKAEAVLRRIAALETLSRDVKDIVTRMTQDRGRTTDGR
jgi:aminopeptidase N